MEVDGGGWGNGDGIPLGLLVSGATRGGVCT